VRTRPISFGGHTDHETAAQLCEVAVASSEGGLKGGAGPEGAGEIRGAAPYWFPRRRFGPIRAGVLPTVLLRAGDISNCPFYARKKHVVIRNYPRNGMSFCRPSSPGFGEMP